MHEPRQERGGSHQALAHQAGLDRTYVSGIERGTRNPTLDIIYRLARALSLPVAVLLSAAAEDISRFWRCPERLPLRLLHAGTRGCERGEQVKGHTHRSWSDTLGNEAFLLDVFACGRMEFRPWETQ